MSLNAHRPRQRDTTGFTLAELLVTLVIVSVGMLGLLKMEAAGVAESQVSRVRSLLTYQAESLAGLMRANRGYWAARTFTTFPSFFVPSDGTTPTYPTGFSTGNSIDSTCMTTVCSPADMAYADLTKWASGFSGAFPGATATVTCTAPSAATCSASAVVPTSYDITLTWHEKSVAINRGATGTNATAGANNGVSMVLHVQP